MGKCIEQILLKEEAQMTSKYMKEMFTIGERQIKMTLRPHFKPIRVTNIKKKTNIGKCERKQNDCHQENTNIYVWETGTLIHYKLFHLLWK